MQGIMFKEPLFHKVLAKEKNKTRRLVFSEYLNRFFSEQEEGYITFEGMETDPHVMRRSHKTGDPIVDKNDEPVLYPVKGTFAAFESAFWETMAIYTKPRYQPDEVVYIKEPYYITNPIRLSVFIRKTGVEYPSTKLRYRHTLLYAYDIPPESRKYVPELGKKWHNKLFMEEKYARYFVKITDVTVEKLKAISEADCIAEGMERVNSPEGYYRNYLGGKPMSTARDSFITMWDKINKKQPFDLNPFVFVYTFILCDKNGTAI